MSEKTAPANNRKRGGGKATKRSRAEGRRLGPGELDKLVLGYMRRHKNDAPAQPERRRKRDRALLGRGGQLP